MFLPWIGQNYSEEGLAGIRLLILGESHYGTRGTETPTLTQDVVNKWGRCMRYRFFTVVQKLVVNVPRGEWIPNEKRAAFWDSVAFYNFVQSFPGNKPRCRPTREMWMAAKEPFLQVLEKLQPHFVVVLGVELQRHLPSIPEYIRSCSIQHPSSQGFRYEASQRSIQAALRTAT